MPVANISHLSKDLWQHILGPFFSPFEIAFMLSQRINEAENEFTWHFNQ